MLTPGSNLNKSFPFSLQTWCNISKTSASVPSGVPNTEKLVKARGRRPSAFIVSRCLEPLISETRSTSFWYGFSNETIGNYAVTWFRKRNNKKLCSAKYFPFSERTRSYAWFISVQPRARKERHGVGAKNGLRRRELSQESRIPRHHGIKQIRVNYFNR